ncbi:MAG: hypothetical protein EOP48_18665, partial [Sphingobacteriales bacterium]
MTLLEYASSPDVKDEELIGYIVTESKYASKNNSFQKNCFEEINEEGQTIQHKLEIWGYNQNDKISKLLHHLIDCLKDTSEDTDQGPRSSRLDQQDGTQGQR